MPVKARIAMGKAWKDTELTISASDASNKAKVLTVDTENGKVCHRLAYRNSKFELGEATTVYEPIDLFRNDNYAKDLDLIKFQMLG